MRRLLIGFCALFICNFLITDVEAQDSPAIPKMVFAHYMVCCPMTSDPSVDAMRAEVRLAKESGFDGFALNVGSWTRQPRYQRWAMRLYEAARLEGDFRLFLSIDNLPLDEAGSAVAEVAEQPASLRIDGRLVVSTYGGTPESIDALYKEIAGRKISVFLVPSSYYWGRNISTPLLSRGWQGDPSVPNAATALVYMPLDGYFDYGAAGDYRKLSQNIRAITGIMHASGRMFMAGVSPYYRGLGGNSRLFDGRGFEGMQAQWLASIEAGADWVQIVTWNDWNESSYITEPPNWSYPPTWAHKLELMDHSGFRKASEYYIKWFKTGTPPPIEQDRLFYFYQPHLKSAMGQVVPKDGELGQPRGFDTLEDKVYFTTFLTAPATLVVQSGTATTEFTLAAGITNVSAPKELGDIHVELRRNGTALASTKLPDPVTEEGTLANFNYLARELPLAAP